MNENLFPFSFFYSGVDEMNDYWLVVLDVHYSDYGDSGAENPDQDGNSTIEFQTSMSQWAVAILKGL